MPPVLEVLFLPSTLGVDVLLVVYVDAPSCAEVTDACLLPKWH